MMLPKEHGAYGQLGFPLATALAAAEFTAASLLFAVAAIALFVAHEPLLVLLNQRGARALREEGGRARFWLTGALIIAGVAGVMAIALTNPSTLWTLLLPIIPGACLVLLTLRGHEKTSLGETLAAVTFALIAVPVSAAGGLHPAIGIAIAVAFAFLFVASTLAVRVVILRTRGGGQPQAARHTRNLALTVAAAGFVVAIGTSTAGVLPGAAAFAITPGLLFAIVVATFPPRAVHLRRVGWTLVAVSALTSILLIAIAATATASR